MKALSEQVVAALAVPVVACDEAGTIVLANEAARVLAGVPELVGTPLASLVPERMRSLDGVPLALALARRARDRDPGAVRLAVLRRGQVEIEVDCVAAGGDGVPLVLSFATIHEGE